MSDVAGRGYLVEVTRAGLTSQCTIAPRPMRLRRQPSRGDDMGDKGPGSKSKDKKKKGAKTDPKK